MAETDAPSRRRRAPDERRDQLLQAAAEVLQRRGLGATTIADVARAAGVAKGTTYLYFDSKDALIAALRARYLDDFSAALAPHEPDASAGARLDAFVTGLFEFAAANQALHHALFHEAGFSEHDAMASAHQRLEQIVADGAGAGEFALDDHGHAATATFLLAGVHGLLIDHLHGDDRRSTTTPTRTAVDRAIELSRRAVGTAP